MHSQSLLTFLFRNLDIRVNSDSNELQAIRFRLSSFDFGNLETRPEVRLWDSLRDILAPHCAFAAAGC